LKTDVTDIDSFATKFVMALKPKSYKFIIGDNAPVRDADGQQVVEEINGEKVPKYTTRPGIRTHLGFLSQDIKLAADTAGVENYAGWGLADKNDPDSMQSIRMGMLLPVVTSVVQKHEAVIATLEARLTALENK
jgi:hypothetical protein